MQQGQWKTYLWASVLAIALGGACQTETKPETPGSAPTPAASPPPPAAPRPAPADTDFTFYIGKGFGLIDRAATPALLRERYGAAYVREDLVDLQEGERTLGSIVFPGTPDAVEIIYADGDNLRDAVFARIKGDGSRWKSPEGLRIGATLAEVEKINGRPFSFYGFEWDSGGMAADWLGGKLYYGVSLRLAPEGEAPEKFMGETTWNSNDPEVRKLNLRVVEIIQRLDAATLNYQ
jgi:hypothetical protein